MNKIALTIIAAFLGGIMQFAIAGQHKLESLSVDMAYIRAPIPGSSMTAAFLTISNGGKENCTLISASSAFAEKIEFHTHQHSNGMMKMRPVDSVEVTANSQLAFKPGGLHLMLFGVKPDATESAEITLVSSHCGELTFDAPIRSMKSSPAKVMHH